VSLALTTAQNTIGAGTDTLSFIENLTGSSFNDTLTGNAAKNTLNGGLGNDRLTGGAGADVFVFNTAPNATSNVDTITDFQVSADKIYLENAIFTALGASTGTLSAAAFWKNTTGVANDGSDRIVYNSTTGALFYDSNGNGSGGSVQIAKLAANLALTNSDFVII
jgi:Ca2+-binding RTX toxin-like protein